MKNIKEKVLKDFEEICPIEVNGNKCPLCEKECPKWGVRTHKKDIKVQSYYCSDCNYRFNKKAWKMRREILRRIFISGRQKNLVEVGKVIDALKNKEVGRTNEEMFEKFGWNDCLDKLKQKLGIK